MHHVLRDRWVSTRASGLESSLETQFQSHMFTVKNNITKKKQEYWLMSFITIIQIEMLEQQTEETPESWTVVGEFSWQVEGVMTCKQEVGPVWRHFLLHVIYSVYKHFPL